jgi:hypothetical protein
VSHHAADPWNVPAHARLNGNPPNQGSQVIPNYKNPKAANNKKKPKSGPTQTLETEGNTNNTTQHKNKHTETRNNPKK